jgi:hypothetical protein
MGGGARSSSSISFHLPRDSDGEGMVQREVDTRGAWNGNAFLLGAAPVGGVHVVRHSTSVSDALVVTKVLQFEHKHRHTNVSADVDRQLGAVAVTSQTCRRPGVQPPAVASAACPT